MLIRTGSNVSNFTDAGSKAYDDDQIELELVVLAIYNGDLIIHENFDHLDMGLVETDSYNSTFISWLLISLVMEMWISLKVFL